MEGGHQSQSPEDFAKVLKQAKGRDDENIIKTVVLRTMKQATYTPVNEGHFGLAFEDYALTLPLQFGGIQTLLVHRAIKRALSSKV